MTMAGIVSADIHTPITDEQGHPHTTTPSGRYLAILSLTALGIVYGDIGTSLSSPTCRPWWRNDERMS